MNIVFVRPARTARAGAARVGGPRARARALGALLASCALALASEASAQAVRVAPTAGVTAAPDPPSRDPWRAPVGLEMEGRLGGQSFLDPSAPGLINSATMGTSRGGAGAAGEAAMGVRVLPWLSLGTHVAYGWSPPGEPRGDWQRAHADAFTIAAYARFYPGTLLRLGRFSPWLSAAFAPIAQLFVSTDYLVQGATVTATVTTTAFAVPLEVGLDYDITPAFYVGAVARLTPWFPLTRCLGGITALGAPQQGCSDTGLHAGDTSLFVGLGVGLRLFR